MYPIRDSRIARNLTLQHTVSFLGEPANRAASRDSTRESHLLFPPPTSPPSPVVSLRTQRDRRAHRKMLPRCLKPGRLIAPRVLPVSARPLSLSARRSESITPAPTSGKAASVAPTPTELLTVIQETIKVRPVPDHLMDTVLRCAGAGGLIGAL